MSTPRYREREDQNLWNFLFSVFFFIVLAAALYLIWRTRGGFPSTLPWLDLVLMAFATLRITRLVVYDNSPAGSASCLWRSIALRKREECGLS